MERKVPFVPGETYHLYSRGVEKRTVFMNDDEYARFLALLFLCNNTVPVNTSKSMRNAGGFPSDNQGRYEQERLVDILCYALMPNHFHLVVREVREGGISKFMLKLMTSYSMFFNTKYERSGPLFTRPFRSKHVNTDEYLRWLFAYIHLNPVELLQKDWREQGIEDITSTSAWLTKYKYSSYFDYFIGSRPESCIVTREGSWNAKGPITNVDDLFAVFSEGEKSLL